MKFEFKMPDSFKNLSDEEKKGIEAIFTQLAEQIKANISIDGIVKEVVAGMEAKGFSQDKIEQISNALKEQGKAITSLKETPAGTNTNALGARLEKALKSSEFTEAMKSGKGGYEIEIKADPTTITAANFANAQPWALSHEVLPGIGVAPSEPNVIFQLLNSGATNSRDIYWVNRKPVNGAAAFIGEGDLKPLVDWTYETATSNAKKIADATKVSTEMLHDFPFMESEIREVLRSLIEDKVDEQLLNGDGTGDNLTGILKNASAYVGTKLDGTVPNANIVDAIRALVLQLRLQHQRPNVVLLNPSDKAALDLLKNTSGNYIAVEAKGVIAPLRIIETTAIEAGKVVVMDTAKFKVRVYEGIKIAFGWENDDFRRNLVTVICEMRLHSYHNSIDDSAIAYDSVATIVAALNKAETAKTTA